MTAGGRRSRSLLHFQSPAVSTFSVILEKDLMTKSPARYLAALTVLLAGAQAFGQIQQVGHRKDSQGSYIGYSSSNWNCDPCQMDGRHGRRARRDDCNPCDQGSGISRIWTDCKCMNDSCIGRCCATKAYPDTGWAPPAHMPVNYDGVWYGAYHPQAWYGNPGGGFVANYPTVYQPTDTTQLGYYYHKVPTWQSRPGMIPPVPQPGQYHVRSCANGCGHGCNSYNGGGYAGPAYGGGCQSCQNGGMAYSAPAFGQPAFAAPTYSSPDGRVVQQAPLPKEGLLGGFRFTSFSDMWD